MPVNHGSVPNLGPDMYSCICWSAVEFTTGTLWTLLKLQCPQALILLFLEHYMPFIVMLLPFYLEIIIYRIVSSYANAVSEMLSRGYRLSLFFSDELNDIVEAISK